MKSLNVESIKEVDKFRYLGSTVTSDARDITTIKINIAKAKATFGRLRNVLTNSKLSMNVKLSIVNTFVYSVLLYGCVAWTLLKESEDRLEAMEMWIYRRILKIPWTDKVSNKEVLERMGKERCLLSKIRMRQLKFFGHVYRHETMEKLAVSGMIEGKRKRGRQRTTYLTSLRRATSDESSNVTFARMADDRQVWRSMIGNVHKRAGHR